jgi:hypothetical protein
MEVSGFFEQDVVDLTHDDEPDASLSSTLEAVASYKRTNGNTNKTDIIEDPTDKENKISGKGRLFLRLCLLAQKTLRSVLRFDLWF